MRFIIECKLKDRESMDRKLRVAYHVLANRNERLIYDLFYGANV